MHTVTKKDIVDRVAQRTKVNRLLVRRVVQDFLGQISEELVRGHRIEFRHFGVFEPRERAARTAQNPRTLQPVVIPARRIVKFKVGRVIRDRIDGNAPPALGGVEVKPAVNR
ncbi:MAG: HU family DNA-binding protein [Phycisphaerales bacterium]|nr:HU family DNA-binding protein [Phycisphaerales bacterium]